PRQGTSPRCESGESQKAERPAPAHRRRGGQAHARVAPGALQRRVQLSARGHFEGPLRTAGKNLRPLQGRRERGVSDRAQTFLTEAMTLVFLVILVTLAFTYTNGFHDTANSIATVVSTKVLTPRQAIVLATVFNLVGALAGTAVAA